MQRLPVESSWSHPGCPSRLRRHCPIAQDHPPEAACLQENQTTRQTVCLKAALVDQSLALVDQSLGPRDQSLADLADLPLAPLAPLADQADQAAGVRNCFSMAFGVGKCRPQWQSFRQQPAQLQTDCKCAN